MKKDGLQGTAELKSIRRATTINSPQFHHLANRNATTTGHE
jgi:hypothetical protein